jgi:hypothetical protein
MHQAGNHRESAAGRASATAVPHSGRCAGQPPGSEAAAWQRLGEMGLVATLLLGVLLRFALAGRGMWFGEFPHIRSAHSHLGYYGVLFPFVWAQWSRRGQAVPSLCWRSIYGIATVAASVDFAIHGYAPVSIIGSTIVLGVWISSALPRLRHQAQPDWSAVAPIAILASSVIIPVVAVLSSRQDPAATLWVQAFLSWLLLGVGAGSGMDALDAPPPPKWLHALAVLGTGFALGPIQHPITRLFLILEAWILIQAAWRGRGPLELRVCWSLAGLGFAGVGSGAVAWNAVLAVAALHFLLLGPVLVVLAAPNLMGMSRMAYLLAVAAFGGCIAMTAFSDRSWWPITAAWTGSGIAAFWILRAILRFRPRSNAQSPPTHLRP